MESFTKEEIESYMSSNNYKDILDNIPGTKKEKNEKILKISLFALREVKTKEEIEKALRIIGGCYNFENKQLKEHFDRVKQILRPEINLQENMVFTTLFDSPKMLLEI